MPANYNTGLGSQRHSDPGSSPPLEVAESADATLSGDLERLSQHLQSARAMYDSQSARGGADSYNRYAESQTYRQHNGYNPGLHQGLNPQLTSLHPLILNCFKA